MQDRELKKLLTETCPVRPGQENRAWAALRQELFLPRRKVSTWALLFLPTRRGAIVAALALVLAIVGGDAFLGQFVPRSLATADSQSPGIYATAFYSRPAQAQVVWLNGMDPASDRPTYLDPTTEVPKTATGTTSPTGDPNSL